MSDPKLIFADNNATTPVAPEVVEAMQPFFGPEFFNPSSMYEPALKVAGLLKASRQAVATFLGDVNPSEVLFTSCATESNNAAIFGVAAANPARPRFGFAFYRIFSARTGAHFARKCSCLRFP